MARSPALTGANPPATPGPPVDGGTGEEPVAHRGMIALSVMVATILQALDMTIANVALPTMQGELSATQDQISWVLTSYIVATAIFMPVTGFLAARFGRKRLFVVGIGGFVIASMLCGIATSLEEIVFYRVLQGAFGAFLLPLSQTTLLDIYPPEKHGAAMAMWGVGVMIGPIMGPTLGGYFTEYYDWRWVFFINLPFGLVALAGVLSFMNETPRDSHRRLDWFGFLMLALAVGSAQMMLDRGELEDWFSSTEIIIEATIAGLALYLFVVHTLTARRPFIDPHIFIDRNIIAGFILIFVFGALLVPTMALLPPYLQVLMDYPVVTVGLVLAPRGFGAMVAFWIVSRISHIVDQRLITVAGLAIIAWSMWLMTGFNADMDSFTIVWVGAVQGFGLGMFFSPINAITFATLAPRLRGDATGLFNLVRSFGSSAGVAAVVALLSRNTQINHAELVGHVTPYNPMMQSPYLPPQWDLDSLAGLAAFNAEITRQAAAIAYINDFKLLMIVTLAAIPLVLLFKLPRRAPTIVPA